MQRRRSTVPLDAYLHRLLCLNAGNSVHEAKFANESSYNIIDACDVREMIYLSVVCAV